ncbi:MAG: hypothetical protein WAO91_04605 [Candidatus Nitrosotenuis sp.]
MKIEEEPELPENFNYNGGQKDIYEDLIRKDNYLSPFRDKKFADVFLYAMVLGYKEGKREPKFKKRVPYIPTTAFSNEAQWLIMALAIFEEKDLQVLFNMKKVAIMAEEYANAGIPILHKLVKDAALGDPDKVLETELRDILKNKSIVQQNDDG